MYSDEYSNKSNPKLCEKKRRTEGRQTTLQTGIDGVVNNSCYHTVNCKLMHLYSMWDGTMDAAHHLIMPTVEAEKQIAMDSNWL